MKLEERELRKMFNHWEIHEVNGRIVFVEISCYASRCLYMDDLCEQVLGVKVFKNTSPYEPDVLEIEKGGEDYENFE